MRSITLRIKHALLIYAKKIYACANAKYINHALLLAHTFVRKHKVFFSIIIIEKYFPCRVNQCWSKQEKATTPILSKIFYTYPQKSREWNREQYEI